MSGEEDVAQGPPGRVRGDRLRLHAVDHDGHAEVDVGGEEDNVKYEVVIQSRSIHLQDISTVYFCGVMSLSPARDD